MSKIGIVTWFGSKNYGTNIQVYALYKKISDLGYSCDLISAFEMNRFSWKNLVKYILFIFQIEVVINKYNVRKDLKWRKILKFLEEDISIRRVYTHRQYKKMLQEYSIFVTGSDQIWNPHYLKEFYLLDFVGTKRRIAYSSSIGVEKIPDNKVKIYKKYLSKFDYISLRENTGCYIISKLLNRKDIRKVVDPTFLLSPEEWKRFGGLAELEVEFPAEYILCYLIGDRKDYKSQVMDVQRRIGISNVLIIQSAENENFMIEGAFVYRNAGPREFVQLIRNAALVCTDSFHATAICINISVNFVEFVRFDDADSHSQNSRIYDLLNRYQLNGRLYSSWDGKALDNNDYKKIQTMLENDRKYSLSFLINAIEA